MNASRDSAVGRRTLLKASAAAAALQVTSPFIIRALGDTPVRIGLVDPLTGVYAAIAQSEVEGAKLATEQVNKKGGILGRPVALLVEDSANDVGIGVQKTGKLIERDQVSFIIGDVNSGIALAMAQVTSEKKVLHIVSGGHTDAITGSSCSWNVYRVCGISSRRTTPTGTRCRRVLRGYSRRRAARRWAHLYHSASRLLCISYPSQGVWPPGVDQRHGRW
jgi:branched-chain amino acid transport system substrate-binding protein